MSTVQIDCKSASPQLPFQPAYHPCWGHRELPSTLQFAAGPSTPIPPNTACNTGWPTTAITGTLTRTGACDFAWAYSSGSGSFGILFAWTLSTPPIVCQVNQAALYPQFSFANATGAPSGSCSQNPTTGVVTMTFSGVISDGFCTCPVTVTFNG